MEGPPSPPDAPAREGADGYGSTAGGTAALAAAVLLARVWILLRFAGNFDTEAFRVAANLALEGRNVYAGTHLYNYSPLWAGIVAVLWKLSRPDVLRFVHALGLLQTGSDVASAFLVGSIARRLGRTPREARLAGLLFFSNPLSVLASSAHGQFDSLAILPLLAAIALALGVEEGIRRRRTAIVVLLAASLLIKHVTAFQPLLFGRRWRRGGLRDLALLTPYAVFLASLLPFASAWRAIWANVILYGTHGAQPSGLLHLVLVPEGWRILFTAVLGIAVLRALRAGRDLELPRASLLLWLTTLTFLPAYGVQYLVWPLAVGSLYPSLGLAVFTLVGALFHSGTSLRLSWPVGATSLGTWAAAALWLGLEGGRLRRSSPESG